VIVYTALFGDYDKLRSTSYPDVEHVLFTDKDRVIPGWRTVVVERQFYNPARENRYYKLQPQKLFPGERVLYHDASMQLKTHPLELLEWFNNQTRAYNSLYALEHPLLHTLPMEFDWVREQGMVDEEILRDMEKRYASVPKDSVGIEARLLISTPGASKFFDVWWSEVERYAHRDQLSFHYARFKAPCSMGLVPLKAARHHFKIAPHSKKQLQNAK